ncbi:MAG: hypothetical protein QXX64_06185, partial [Nitrososphaera sp.]
MASKVKDQVQRSARSGGKNDGDKTSFSSSLPSGNNNNIINRSTVLFSVLAIVTLVAVTLAIGAIDVYLAAACALAGNIYLLWLLKSAQTKK